MFKTLKLWWKTWLWARRINKRLLAQVKQASSEQYAPPTPAELRDFVADMAAHGVTFNSMCTGMPKHPRVSREVTI